MNASTGKWEPISHPVPANVTEFRVPKLKEGEEYNFRVRAENELGTGEPLDSDHATKVKNPFGMFRNELLFLTCFHWRDGLAESSQSVCC